MGSYNPLPRHLQLATKNHQGRLIFSPSSTSLFSGLNICCRLVLCTYKFGLQLATYSPLALVALTCEIFLLTLIQSPSGGFLVGKYLSKAKAQPGSHFDTNWLFGLFYITHYMPMLPALQVLKDLVVKYLSFHSVQYAIDPCA
jgi:hypothetical protein